MASATDIILGLTFGVPASLVATAFLLSSAGIEIETDVEPTYIQDNRAGLCFVTKNVSGSLTPVECTEGVKKVAAIQGHVFTFGQ